MTYQEELDNIEDCIKERKHFQCPACDGEFDGEPDCDQQYCPLSAHGWARDTEHAKQMSSMFEVAG